MMVWRLLQQNAEAAGRDAMKRPDAYLKSNRHATAIRHKLRRFPSIRPVEVKFTDHRDTACG
jgi:hypothetical protein